MTFRDECYRSPPFAAPGVFSGLACPHPSQCGKSSCAVMRRVSHDLSLGICAVTCSLLRMTAFITTIPMMTGTMLSELSYLPPALPPRTRHPRADGAWPCRYRFHPPPQTQLTTPSSNKQRGHASGIFVLRKHALTERRCFDCTILRSWSQASHLKISAARCLLPL